MPALLRYTGVLYEALDVRGLSRAARARAAERLLITSALFGIVGGDDAACLPAVCRLDASRITRPAGILAVPAGRADRDAR